MQNKIHHKTSGIATLYIKQAIKFALKWPEKGHISLSGLEKVNKYAAWPEMTVGIWTKRTPEEQKKLEEALDRFPECQRPFALSLFESQKFRPGMMVQEFAKDYAFSPDFFVELLNLLRRKWRGLEKTRTGKLKRFISRETAVKWDESCAQAFGDLPNFRAAVREAEKIREKLASTEPKPNPMEAQLGAISVTEEYKRFFREAQRLWNNREHRNSVVPDKMGNVAIWDLQDAQIAIAFENSPGGERVTIEDVIKARNWIAGHQREAEKFKSKHVDENGLIRRKKR